MFPLCSKVTCPIVNVRPIDQGRAREKAPPGVLIVTFLHGVARDVRVMRFLIIKPLFRLGNGRRECLPQCAL